MPDQEPVVWPEDPVEADTRAADAEPEAPVAHKQPQPSWPSSFEEALRESQAESKPAETVAAAPAEPATNEYPTQPSMPAVQAKTQPPAVAASPETAKTVPPQAAKTVPPEPAKTVPPEPAAAADEEEAPTSTFRTPIPLPAQVPEAADPGANGADAAVTAPTTPPAPHLDAESVPLPEAEPVVEAESVPLPEAEPVVEAESVPLPEAEPEVEPAQAVEAEPEPEPEPEPAEPAAPAEPEPAREPEPAPEPASEPAPAPEPVKAVEPAPAPEPQPQPASEPAPKEEEWIPMPVNPPIPSWAPRLGASQPAAEKVDWPGGSNVPSWAPTAGGRTTQNAPAAPREARPSVPVGEAMPQPRPATSTPGGRPAGGSTPPSQPGTAAPATGDSRPKTSSWEIVKQKGEEEQKPAYAGPSAEDKSYAEWFAWAKRSGAPASACHAAAMGAFRALAAGHDMNTAVQWATAAMSAPPGLVSASRQLYCAWYSLGNIDLRLPSPQAHAFATGAIAALEAGADAPSAHQAGLAAAGITG